MLNILCTFLEPKVLAELDGNFKVVQGTLRGLLRKFAVLSMQRGPHIRQFPVFPLQRGPQTLEFAMFLHCNEAHTSWNLQIFAVQ